MKRKLTWTAVFLALLLLGFGAVLFLWPRDRVTHESFEMIRVGMTENEVEGILGGPGKDLQTFLVQDVNILVDRGITIDHQIDHLETRVWVGRRAVVEIQFRTGGPVIGLSFYVRRRSAEPTIIERLREWLGW
jgi:hypothetical protein